jgi:hypothetical protein
LSYNLLIGGAGFGLWLFAIDFRGEGLSLVQVFGAGFVGCGELWRLLVLASLGKEACDRFCRKMNFWACLARDYL